MWVDHGNAPAPPPSDQEAWEHIVEEVVASRLYEVVLVKRPLGQWHIDRVKPYPRPGETERGDDPELRARLVAALKAAGLPVAE